MIKTKYLVASVASAGVLSLGAFGIVSAATPYSATTPTTKNTTVGKSGIPRTTFMQDRLDAVAQVLHTSTANVQTARKNKTVSQLITSTGLTKKTFGEKVKTQLTTELEGQGYSQDQVIIALQHRAILRLRHHNK